MMKPDKYTDLKLSVIGIAYLVLKSLGEKYTKLDKILGDISSEVGEDSKYNFTNALNLLYMTGKIDYNVRRDSIRRGAGKLEDQ